MKRARTILIVPALLLTFIVTKQLNVMQDTEEIWKDIPSLTGYQASTAGRIKSITRTIPHARFGQYIRPSKILTPFASNCGYLRVGLICGKKLKYLSIHRLVAMTFIPNPNNKETVNHIDGNKENNIPTNLEWNTQKENVHHSMRIGIKGQAKGIQFINRCKLDELQVRVIRSLEKEMHPRDIAVYFNINRTSVYDIFKGRTWKHIL